VNPKAKKRKEHMENEAVKPEETPGPVPEGPQTTFAILEGAELKLIVMNAFKSMGTTMLQMSRQMEADRETLKRVLVERSELVDLLTRLTEQMKAFTQLQDSDHAAIEVLMASRENGMGPRHVH
jgi:hypothetical protein